MTENTTATAKPEPKAKAVPHACKCGVPGCEGVTLKTFAPGHDQKAVGYTTKQVVKGETTADQAIEFFRSIGASETLVGKLTAAIKRVTKAEAAKAERTAKAKAEREVKAKEREEAREAKAKEKAAEKNKVAFAREQAAKVKTDLAAKAQAESGTAEAKANA